MLDFLIRKALMGGATLYVDIVLLLISPLTSTWPGCLALAALCYLFRHDFRVVFTLMLVVATVCTRQLLIIEQKAQETKVYVQMNVGQTKEQAEGAIHNGIKTLSAHVGQAIEQAKTEVIQNAASAQDAVTKLASQAEGKLESLKEKAQDAIRPPSKITKLKRKAFKVRRFILRSPLAHTIAKVVLVVVAYRFLRRWFLYTSVSLKGNRGRGGNLSFTRSPIVSLPEEEEEREEEGDHAALLPTIPPIAHFAVVPIVDGISDADNIALLSSAQGLQESERLRFVVGVQFLQNEILHGKADLRGLKLFIEANGELLLPYEAEVLGAERGQSVRGRLRALEGQERLRREQCQAHEERWVRWRQEQERRMQEVQERRQRMEAAQNARREARQRHNEAVRQCQREGQEAEEQRLRQQREEQERREREAQERRAQARAAQNERQEMNQRHSDAVRQRRTEAEEQRLQQKRGEQEAEKRQLLQQPQEALLRADNQDSMGPTMLINQVVAGQGGRGGTRHGGIDENPMMERSWEKGPFNEQNAFPVSSTLKQAAASSARTLIKQEIGSVSREVAEQVSKTSVAYVEAAHKAKAAEQFLEYQRWATSRLHGGDDSYFTSGLADAYHKSWKANGALKQALQGGIKRNLKKQAVGVLKNTAKKVGGGTLASAGVQYGFSAAGTTYKCLCGRSEKFKDANGKMEKLYALGSEIYDDAPSVKKVAAVSLAGTLGGMVGAMGGPIGALAGGIVCSGVAEWWFA